MVCASKTTSGPDVTRLLETIETMRGDIVSTRQDLVRLSGMTGDGKEVVGGKPAIASKDAGTDALWIYALGDIPVIKFGLRNGVGAMNADENVVIDDPITTTKAISRIRYDVLVDGAEPGGA